MSERLKIEKILQNRYEIVNQLGRGGMGAVYLAKDLRFDDSYVALKKITIEFDKLDEKQQKLFKTAFEREANLLAKLSHESIPRVTDYFSESDSQYLVMELVDGDDLGALLGKQVKHFPVGDVLDWSFQILDALDYLHNQNPQIIHRDLKPANLKLTTRGKIKLLDFGIAKGNDGKSANATTVTNHTFVGATLNYSPIEQLFRVIDPNYRDFIIEKFADKAITVLNQNADTRSDTFALGATFYHLTTGLLPNDALKRALDVWAGKPDPLPNPSELNPEISPELAEVLLKSLATDVDARFSSAKEMSEALHQAVADEKARKAKSASINKPKKNKPIDLDNLPIHLNPDETQPFFPQQVDFGEKTQIDSLGNQSHITKVEAGNIIQPNSVESDLIQDTQVGQQLFPQDTQLNPVTSTQEPKFDNATLSETPVNNEVTRLPNNTPNSELTGISYLNKDFINESPSEKPVQKSEIRNDSTPNENKGNPTEQNGATVGSLSKNSVIGLVSAAGIGLAVLGSCVLGIMFFTGGNSQVDNRPVNKVSTGNYVPAPETPSNLANSNPTTTTLDSSNTTSNLEQSNVSSDKTPTPQKKETQKVSEPPKPKETPVVAQPKVEKTPEIKKPVSTPKPKISDDCLYNRKC